MTAIKFNNSPMERSLTNLVDEIFTGVPAMFKNEIDSKLNANAPVNIVEKENVYQIDVMAPGFDKNDFRVNLENNVLTISAEKTEESTSQNNKYIKKEFYVKSFKRIFTVDNKIDTDNISAKYVNGILIVTLNKKEEAKATSKNIEIE